MTDALTMMDGVADGAALDHAIARARELSIVLPTFAELCDPETIPAARRARLAQIDPDAPDPANLLRVHWWNDASRRGFVRVPEHVVLPPSFTGVESPIVVLLGDRFPMIRAHKVLAAYACLAPRLVTGRFDPTRHRAVWPSTGNYCRGGVAISRILGCRGVAVLPEGMSHERFEWLSRWTDSAEDVIRTPGTESNVKEIYDECGRLSRDPANVVINQFSEFGNYLAHWLCTGRAAEAAFEAARATRPGLELAAFVSATGSAGTIAAGDRLKETHGARIAAVEALECPTLLENGFGEHQIQGIGDKHVPFIHNVMNGDAVIAVSDRATDSLYQVVNSEEGRDHLRRARRVPEKVIAALDSFGLSSLCNVIASVKLARALGLGPHQAIVTVATDGAAMYASEMPRIRATRFEGRFDAPAAAESYGRHLLGAGAEHVLLLDEASRRRIFNLGYFTWVEQQGVSIERFTARRSQGFWRELRRRMPEWDAAIAEFNRRSGAGSALA